MAQLEMVHRAFDGRRRVYTPYQGHVDVGRLVVRAYSYTNAKTGVRMATSQLRVTVKGPTDLYNLFDDPRCDNPSIQRLREAHHAVEFAILTEYGWQDLHGPWTFDRPWIDGTWRHVPPAATRRAYLERLAALNHEQAAAAAKDKSR